MSIERLLSPFSGLSVSHSTDHHTVNAAFHSGGLFDDVENPVRVGNPCATCYRYPERTPIFAISQGALYAQMTTVNPDRVTGEDLEAARRLAEAAASYFEELDRFRRRPPGAAPARTTRRRPRELEP